MIFFCHAKWIMAGEHTVINGGKALAFPLQNFGLSIGWNPSKNLNIYNIKPKFRENFIDLLNSASDFCGIALKKISGNFYIKSNIITGAGLGSSAALCLNLARIFGAFEFCPSDKILPLATHLENIFHGKSSGLDVAVVAANKGVIFQHNTVKKLIDFCLWPHLLLTYSGQVSATSECSAIVNDLYQKNLAKAKDASFMMSEGTDLCESGLIKGNFSDLKKGINFCNKAFEEWGLYSSSLRKHAEMLVAAGAAAVKPVGAGLGGFMLSLWEDTPPKVNGSILVSENTGI